MYCGLCIFCFGAQMQYDVIDSVSECLIKCCLVDMTGRLKLNCPTGINKVN